MNSQTDQQLLREYAEGGAEESFAELVRRRTDLVYSAALRMVREPQLAEDVSQGVFIALAQNARHLIDRPVLSGWLHRTALNIAVKVVRADARRRGREQEAAAMNQLLSSEPDATWEQIAPHLDVALGQLNESERDAVMLRYFERKSAREMAEMLGVSDEAAQKRVSRAVERLRQLLAKRGVAVGSSGLVLAVSANAIQAAPAGLAATFSTAALVGGASAIGATTSLVALTPLKMALAGAAVTAAALAAPLVIEYHAQSKLRTENQALRQQLVANSSPLPAATTDTVATAAGAAALPEVQFHELLRLRGEVGRLRQEAQELAGMKTGAAASNDPMAAEVNAWLARVHELQQALDARPDQKIPELQYLTPRDWLNVARDARLESDAGARQAFGRLRTAAKQAFAPFLRNALNRYMQANGGAFPSNLSQLTPFFDAPVEDALLARYQLLSSSGTDDEQGPVVTEKVPVDAAFDSLISVGVNGASLKSQSGGSSAGSGSYRVVRLSGLTNNPAAAAGSLGDRWDTSGSFIFRSGAEATNMAPAPR